MKPPRQITLPQFDVIRLLRILAEHECHDCVWWHCDLTFFVGCNDVFCWACADAEPVASEADVDALEQALKDADDDGAMLYCARKRGMRPQGALYKHIDPANRHWFDECGPEREVGPGNPAHQSSVGRGNEKV